MIRTSWVPEKVGNHKSLARLDNLKVTKEANKAPQWENLQPGQSDRFQQSEESSRTVDIQKLSFQNGGSVEEVPDERFWDSGKLVVTSPDGEKTTIGTENGASYVDVPEDGEHTYAISTYFDGELSWKQSFPEGGGMILSPGPEDRWLRPEFTVDSQGNLSATFETQDFEKEAVPAKLVGQTLVAGEGDGFFGVVPLVPAEWFIKK